jgi:undecaprenyl-diphosphatase
MNYFDAIILGIVEGLTEFLPVSSTGHLMIAEKALGLPIDDRALGAYTAVIQMGAIAAVLLYFFGDIWRIAKAWTVGLLDPRRRSDADHKMGWYVIVGSVPIGVVGFLGQDVITGPFKNLWVVAGGLILWSLVLVYAERVGAQSRGESKLNLADVLAMGLMQCVALIPGVSRSGATVSAGLMRGLDRVAATRMAFFLGIPSLTAAGLYELKDVAGIGAGPAIVGTVVSFAVAYASVAWLLKFVAHHSFAKFVPYRVAVGALLVGLLVSGALAPR